MKVALSLFAVFLATIVGILLLWAGIIVFRYFTAEIRGIVTAEEQIESAGSRIARYEYFFDLCASVQANEVVIDRLTQQLENPNLESKDRIRLETTLTGVISARTTSATKYNSEATKSYTSARFHDSDLPYQLPITYQGVPTQCAI